MTDLPDLKFERVEIEAWTPVLFDPVWVGAIAHRSKVWRRMSFEDLLKLVKALPKPQQGTLARSLGFVEPEPCSSWGGLHAAHDSQKVRADGLEAELQEVKTRLATWTANVKEVELALGYDKPDGMTLAEARSVMRVLKEAYEREQFPVIPQAKRVESDER